MCHSTDGAEDGVRQQSRLDSFLTGGLAVPAPNLTDLRTRESLGAGLMDGVNEANLRAWLRNPEDIKIGNLMSGRAAHLYDGGNIKLSDAQVDALIAYLLNLQ